MSGARGTEVALLIAGLQNDWCHSEGVLARCGRDMTAIPDVVRLTKRLVAEARRRSYPIIFVKNTRLAGGQSDSAAWLNHSGRGGLNEGTPGATEWGRSLVTELGATENDLVVDTFRLAAFSDTRTDVLLRSARTREIVLAGVETHAAVLATAIQATALDYKVTVVSDCIGGTVPALDRAATVVLARWAHLRTLEALWGK